MQATAKKYRPILMSGPMVVAARREKNPKTQTRRLVKFKKCPDHTSLCSGVQWAEPGETIWMDQTDPMGPLCSRSSPYGRPGDLLWVREAWQVWEHEDTSIAELRKRYAANDLAGEIVYRADDDQEPVERWRPGIHMPREFCRLYLEVVSVRVERVQDISEEDCLAEGIESLGWDYAESDDGSGDKFCYWEGRGDPPRGLTSCECPTDVYYSLWDSINGAGSWASNPWCWAISFKRTEAPR